MLRVQVLLILCSLGARAFRTAYTICKMHIITVKLNTQDR